LSEQFIESGIFVSGGLVFFIPVGVLRLTGKEKNDPKSYDRFP
jgi:hypothetical protein